MKQIVNSIPWEQTIPIKDLDEEIVMDAIMYGLAKGDDKGNIVYRQQKCPKCKKHKPQSEFIKGNPWECKQCE